MLTKQNADHEFIIVKKGNHGFYTVDKTYQNELNNEMNPLKDFKWSQATVDDIKTAFNNPKEMQDVEMRNIYYSIFFKTRQMLEPEDIDNDSLIAETVIAIALLLFLYQRHRKRFSERRLKAVRNRPETCIDSDKIILALEL